MPAADAAASSAADAPLRAAHSRRRAPPCAHHPPLHTQQQQKQPKQALARLFQPLLGWASRRYQAQLGSKLSQYGLRYDDLLDPTMDQVRDWGALFVVGFCWVLL